MSDRLTAAGEALLGDWGDSDALLWLRNRLEASIRAIEAEAAARAVDEALSVERLAEALAGPDQFGWLHDNDHINEFNPDYFREKAAALVAHLRGPR